MTNVEDSNLRWCSALGAGEDHGHEGDDPHPDQGRVQELHHRTDPSTQSSICFLTSSRSVNLSTSPPVMS